MVGETVYIFIIGLIIIAFLGCLFEYVINKFTGDKFTGMPAFWAVVGSIIAFIVYKIFGLHVTYCVGIILVIGAIVIIVIDIKKNNKK